MKSKLVTVFFVLQSLLYFSQSFDYRDLEKIIEKNNRLGKHKVSQQVLLNALNDENLNLTDKVKVNLLLAKTFRSINDYVTSISYLKKTQSLSKQLIGEHTLIMQIRAELALAYFDNHDYEESKKIMNYIADLQYKGLNQETQGFLIMQQGYINFLAHNYKSSEEQYFTSEAIIKMSSPCNLPTVQVKQMQLYGKKQEFEKMEEIYRNILRLADSCSILKYKIYATEEIKSIYKENEFVVKAFDAGVLLDSLKVIDARETNLSKMHLQNETFLQKQNVIDRDHSFRNMLVLIGIIILVTVLVIYFYRKSTLYEEVNLKQETEIKEMKQILEIYSQQEFSQAAKDNSILKTELLNGRQKQLLEKLSEGLSNKEIAKSLFISENTVKYHIKNIYLILDLKNRKHLMSKIKKDLLIK